MDDEALAGNETLPRLSFCGSLSVEDANIEPRGLIIASAPTLIYGGRGMDGRSYISFRVWMDCFRARHTLRRARTSPPNNHLSRRGAANMARVQTA